MDSDLVREYHWVEVLDASKSDLVRDYFISFDDLKIVLGIWLCHPLEQKEICQTGFFIIAKISEFTLNQMKEQNQ